jgi:hypothetical protein
VPIGLTCDCGKQLRVRDDLAGKKVRCPECKELLVVPDGQDDESEAAAKVPKAGRQPEREPAGEDEDARPRKRKGDDEDGRPRKKRKQKAGSGMLWIGLAAGAAALVLLAGVGVGGYFLFFASKTETKSTEQAVGKKMAYPPGKSSKEGLSTKAPLETKKTNPDPKPIWEYHLKEYRFDDFKLAIMLPAEPKEYSSDPKALRRQVILPDIGVSINADQFDAAFFPNGPRAYLQLFNNQEKTKVLREIEVSGYPGIDYDHQDTGFHRAFVVDYMLFAIAVTAPPGTMDRKSADKLLNSIKVLK